jgi:hypothetical protein
MISLNNIKIITLKEEKLYLEIWKQERGVQNYNIILKSKEPIVSIYWMEEYINFVKNWNQLLSNEIEYKKDFNNKSLNEMNFSVVEIVEKNKKGEFVKKYIANVKFVVDIRSKRNV